MFQKLYSPFEHTKTVDTTKCVDIPGFTDKYGTTCTNTAEKGNCRDGKPGKINADNLKKDANSQGVSALDACCVCGGGLKGE